MGGYDREILNEASAVLQSNFFINSWTLVITGHLISVVKLCSGVATPRHTWACAHVKFTGAQVKIMLIKVEDQLLWPQISFFQSVCLVHIQMKVILQAKSSISEYLIPKSFHGGIIPQLT